MRERTVCVRGLHDRAVRERDGSMCEKAALPFLTAATRCSLRPRKNWSWSFQERSLSRVLILAQKLGAPNISLVAQRVLPWVHASTARGVIHPLTCIVAHSKLQRVVDGEARREHDAQIRGADMCAILF